MVWTADAWPHPAVVRTLRYAVSISASRNVDSDSAPLILNRWRQEITTTIMRRRAAMARAVLPRRGLHQRWLLSGHTIEQPSSDVRAPLLDDEWDDQSADEERGAAGSTPEDTAAPGQGNAQGACVEANPEDVDMSPRPPAT